MKKVIERLKKVKEIARHGSSSAICFGINEVMAELKAPPRWETPEQWEKRTGEAWPDNGAVYFKMSHLGDDVEWGVCRLVSARRDHDICAVATEAGPPPDGWKPEERQ
jgi:RimJ/RimL family protein N-acetyltransferase